MIYALKTADNSDMFIEHGQPIFVNDPSLLWQYWPVDDTIPDDHYQTGWALVNGVCKAVTAQCTPNRRARLASRIRTRREGIINNGQTVTSGGREFYTDDKSQNDMQKALTLMQLAQISEILWSGSGWTGAVTQTQLATAAVQVGAFVQQAFARRAALLTELDAVADADLETFAATVETFWPAT